MRVLHLFDHYLPSTLSWVSRLLVHLQAVEVWVGAPWIIRNHFHHGTFRYFDFPLQVQPLFPAGREGQYPYWQRLLTRSQRFLPTYSWWLYAKTGKHPPDIIHAHFGPTGCLYLPLANRLGCPLVVTFYGFDYAKLLHNRPVFRRKYEALFNGAARVIAASPTASNALEQLGCPPEKIRIVRPGIDLSLFPLAGRAKQPGTLHLVQAATITAKKGHSTTLEAFRIALKACPNLRLTLAGEPYDQPLFYSLKDYLARHALEGRVSWTGPVDHRNMPGFLAAFDAFIHPSCRTADGDHEATPVVLLEAQSTGLPVLATRHFDLPDQVQEGRTGFLVEEDDAPALAQAISRLYQMDANRYLSMRKQAHQWMAEQFSVGNSAGQLQKIYQELS
ncbi:MAG: glycosyltransferase family 4 protein [Saprospirales bacterium]|nr:glycosyltransferase family 4 protein [Saprospirales bacterium]MBK8922253.1 glycosyltransferase family 4 protein [Saprospirales bacterium]